MSPRRTRTLHLTGPAWGDHVEGFAPTEEGKKENVPIRGSVKL